MTRRYGRARHGERVGEGVPCGHWRTLTVLGAIGVSGWVATMSIESATDGEVFLAFLEQVLCPQLQAGNVVVRIICLPTRWTAYDNSSKNEEPGCTTFLLTLQISTPSKCAGRNSNSFCAVPAPELCPFFNSPLPMR